MANHNINTIPLFKGTVGVQGSGGTCLSDPIDMRDLNAEGSCAVTYAINGTGGIDAGTSRFSYLGAPYSAGPYSAAGTFGSCGTANGQTGIMTFTPVPVPFIKIQGIVGTSNPAVITAELHVK